MKPKRRRDRGRVLLVQHLENISWRVLGEYPRLVREMIKGKHGVYALYRRDKLYYVGLASNLMGRLNSHLKDRHHGAWDRFSVYLTVNSEHIRELESLVLRIVSPSGNRQVGKFAKSASLFSVLNKQMKDLDADRRAVLLGGAVAKRRRKSKASRGKGTLALAGFADKSVQLRGVRRGVQFRAVLRPDGHIRFGGEIFTSPTGAARAAVKGPINGWSFWSFREGKRWVPLRSQRR